MQSLNGCIFIKGDSMYTKIKKSFNGFTLIELIIVLAVLGIIAVIAVPKYLGVKKQAAIDSDYSSAAAIGKAAELYFAQDTNPTSSPTIAFLQDNDYIDKEWDGWQHFNNKSKHVYIEINLDTGGTVGVYAGDNSSDNKLYPKP